MPETNRPVTITTADQGQSYSIAGGVYRFIREGQHTENNFAVIEMVVPPDGGPGPHRHANIEETFYLLEGELEFKSEEGTFMARAGDFVHIPKNGMVHCFKNKSADTARMICTVIPAGLDSFFKELGTPVKAGEFLKQTPPTEEQLKNIKAVAERYGQEIFPPDYLDKA